MKSEVKGILLIILSACSFGSIGIISRVAIARGGGETSIMLIRFFSVSLFFAVYMKLRGISWRVGRKNFLGLMVLGLFFYGNVALMFFLAMKYISPSLGALILYSYPALVMVGSILFLGESFSGAKLAAMLISFAGCAVVLWGPLGSIDFRGVLFAALTALFYAAYIIGSRKILSNVSSLVVSAYMAVWCFVFFLIYGAFSGYAGFSLSTVNITTGLALAVWCTVIGFLAFLGGLKIVGAQNASIISTFEPLYTILLAWLLLGDQINLRQILGGLLILSGVILLNLMGSRKKAQARRLAAAAPGAAAGIGAAEMLPAEQEMGAGV